jgi:hypothetical protein
MKAIPKMTRSEDKDDLLEKYSLKQRMRFDKTTCEKQKRRSIMPLTALKHPSSLTAPYVTMTYHLNLYISYNLK